MKSKAKDQFSRISFAAGFLQKSIYTRSTLMIVLLAIPIASFQHPLSRDPENEKYLNFLVAVQNSSTFSYFTVVRVRNMRSGIIKEICVKGNFLNGAVHRELHLGYDSASERAVLELLLSKKNRYFEFRNRQALKNISFFTYDPEKVQLIQGRYDFDKVIEQIRTKKRFSIFLVDDDMNAFAHVLFNKGYLTGESSCWGGRWTI